MASWWSYSPEDFLLFSERVYWRLFALQNDAWWPLPLATLALGAALAVAPRRWALGALALVWAFVGWSFFWERYASVNWAAPAVAPAFWAQAVALALAGATAAGAAGERGTATAWQRRAGGALLAAGVAGYPLLAPLAGRPWGEAELFGMAPDPTAVATLGVLVRHGRALPGGRWAAALLAVPVLWCVASAATLWTLGAPFAWAGPSAALIALVAWPWAAGPRAPVRKTERP